MRCRAGNLYGYGAGSGWKKDGPSHNPMFGMTVVSCERGVIRQSPAGLFVYDEKGRREIKVPSSRGRAAELFDLYQAIIEDRPTTLDVRWDMATAEVCLAILQSSREHRDILLAHQTESPASR